MIRAELPNLSRRRLIRAARDHALDLAVQYERDTPSGDDHRLVVNMLRHEYTDYDADQCASRHRGACEAIAARYPWLAAECARQIADRDAAERESEEMAQAWLAEQEQQRARRRELVVASRAVIVGLAVGQHVTATVRGHVRHGVLIKVARSRVTMEFTLRSGASRTATLHAAEVAPT